MPLVKVYGATYEHSLGESLSDLVCADFSAARKVLVILFMPNPPLINGELNAVLIDVRCKKKNRTAQTVQTFADHCIDLFARHGYDKVKVRAEFSEHVHGKAKL